MPQKRGNLSVQQPRRRQQARQGAAVEDVTNLFWQFVSAPLATLEKRLKEITLPHAKSFANILGLDSQWARIRSAAHRRLLNTAILDSVKNLHVFHSNIAQTRKHSAKQFERFLRQEAATDKKRASKRKRAAKTSSRAPSEGAQNNHAIHEDGAGSVRENLTHAFEACIHLCPSGSGSVIDVAVARQLLAATEAEEDIIDLTDDTEFRSVSYTHLTLPTIYSV